MTTPINQAKSGESQERLWPYAVTGTILLVVFVTAILIPDYFSYKLRLARIEAEIKASTTKTTPSTQPDNKSEPNNPIPQSQTGNTESKYGPSLSTEPKSSEMFETYGRLLTMLLAFVSVIGVFFGYFVRKSLREVEEDMRCQVKEIVQSWEKDWARLSGEVSSKLTAIDTKQLEVADTIAKSKQALEALQASAKAEAPKLTEQPDITQTAVAAIDADNTIPSPAGE